MRRANPPVFGTRADEHYGTHRNARVTMQPDGRKVEAFSSFILFDAEPVAEGVFRCAVVFGCKTEDQHIGVFPVRNSGVALKKAFENQGFGENGINGWGCKEKDGRVVRAGVAADNARSWKFRNKTVEMVIDATARTVVISTAGEAAVVFNDVEFPVVPAIYVDEGTATLVSSSREFPQTPGERIEDLEKVFSTKVTELQQQIANRDKKAVALEQVVAKQQEQMTGLERQLADQDKKMVALELHSANRDEKAVAFEQEMFTVRGKFVDLETQLAKQDETLRSIEARLFKQGSDELGLQKSLASAEAALQQHSDAVASLEALAAKGTKGLADSIAEEKVELEQAKAKISELQSQLGAAREKKARQVLAMDHGFVPLEQLVKSIDQGDVDTRLKAFEVELIKTVTSSIKEPLELALEGLLENVLEINARIA